MFVEKTCFFITMFLSSAVRQFCMSFGAIPADSNYTMRDEKKYRISVSRRAKKNTASSDSGAVNEEKRYEKVWVASIGAGEKKCGEVKLGFVE
jgi:hypothetical protein